MGKAKPAKHTAAELQAKAKAALTNMGGGKAGQSDRAGGSVGHSRFQCHICKAAAPSIKSMEDHHKSKHPTLPWEPEKCTNLHEAAGGVTTQGVAVRGSLKNK